MNRIRDEEGISLVALAVTIVILLILVGITFVIADGLLLDNAILASNKTIEASLKEKIEIAWVTLETAYWDELEHDPSRKKQDYFNEKFAETLQVLENVSDVKMTGKIEENTYIMFKHQNKEYAFCISKNGKAKIVNWLKQDIKVGDYVNYPLEYTDVYSEEHYTAQNGWRVIDDGKMKGTSGHVRIISTGIPAKWYYDHRNYENSESAVSNLRDNFEELDLLDSLDGVFMKGKAFKNETLADKISSVSLSDFNYAYNEIYQTNRKADEIIDPGIKDELFYRDKSYYWLATNSMENDKAIYYVSSEEIKESQEFRIGIRPVINLKDDLKGVFESGVWKIIN